MAAVTIYSDFGAPKNKVWHWFQIRKGVRQGCMSPCLFNLYAEYIIRNAGLDEAQAGIKIARRNINNLRYADDTTLMEESEEELKSLLMKVKEKSEKVDLKLNTQKTKITASGSTTSWQIFEEKVETVTEFIFLCSKITVDSDSSHEIKKNAFSLEEKLWQPSESVSCLVVSTSVTPGTADHQAPLSMEFSRQEY